MFWPFKKRDTQAELDQLEASAELFRAALKQNPPQLKFQRGDKVRDVYDGPVMFVDNPRELQVVSAWPSIVTRVRVKCVRWNSNEEYKAMIYNEDELVLVERRTG